MPASPITPGNGPWRVDPAAFADRFASGSAVLKIKNWPTFDGRMLNRNQYLTASEAHGCSRRLAYEKGGKHVPKKSGDDKDWTGVQQRGDAVEIFVVDALFAALDDATEAMFWFGVDQVSIYSDELGLSATPDGLILEKQTGWLIPHEIKSVDPRTNIEGWQGPRDKHRDQVITGAMVLEHLIKNGELRKHCPEIYEAAETEGVVLCPYSHIIYVDANDLSRKRSFVVPTNEGYSEEVKDHRQRILNKAALLFDPDGRIFPPESQQAEGVLTGDCTFCGFKSYCSAHKQFFAPETDKKFKAPVARSAATSALRSYALAKQREREAKEMLEEAGPRLKALIGTSGEVQGNTRVLENGQYRAALIEVAGRKSLDAAAVKAELGKAIPDGCYKVGAPSVRLDFETKGEN